MSNRRIEREVLLSYVKEMFDEASYLFFASYIGLTVQQFSELRGKLDDAESACVVLKNTYIELGLKEIGCELPEDFEFTGDTMVVFGSGDPAAAAKVVKEFGKEHDVVTFKGGLLDGRFMSAAAATDLADMPPKEVLLSTLLGTMKGPGQNLVRTLSTRKNTIVWTLENYANKLEEN